MLKWLFLFVSCFYTTFADAQSFRDQMRQLSIPKDSTKMFQLLSKWEQADPSDPELYVGWINYYFHTAKKAIVQIGPSKGQNAIAFQDSAGNNAGYLSEQMLFDTPAIQKGLYYIDRGIAQHPARLDMRFGKIYVLGATGQFAAFTNEVVQTIHYSDTIKNKWLWRDGKPLKDSSEFFLSNIQDYILQLYNEGDMYLGNMRNIAEAILLYHPKDVRFLSNISITYSLQNQPDKALEFLLKAERIAPKDFIILNNIARNYEILGDTANAANYYKLTIKHGDEEAKAAARKKLNELKK